jgi:hypothetical protein
VGGLRPPIFDLENRYWGGLAELYKGGYLILSSLVFLFSSCVGLSRQFFCINSYFDKKNIYFRCLGLFLNIYIFLT